MTYLDYEKAIFHPSIELLVVAINIQEADVAKNR